jgi:hypothetical protein
MVTFCVTQTLLAFEAAYFIVIYANADFYQIRTLIGKNSIGSFISDGEII